MILVTGGTGLVGSHLLYQLLQNKDKVRAIHQKTSDLLAVKNVFSYYTDKPEVFFDKIDWMEASLDDTEALSTTFQDVNYVYHCAAYISFDPKDYKIMRHTNIDGTANIVNLCVFHQIKKLCFVSSIAAIEKAKNGKFTDESENWNNNAPKSGYAISKYGAEIEVWRASQEGVPVIIINPGVILGAGFWQKGSGSIFSKIYHGFPFYTEGATGFVDVLDVVKIMVKLMAEPIENERFILVGKNMVFKDLFLLIADTFRVKKPNIKVTHFLAGIVWRIDYLKSMIFRTPALVTKKSMQSSMEIDNYSSEKLKKYLAYNFIKMETTIERVCKAYKRDH